MTPDRTASTPDAPTTGTDTAESRGRAYMVLGGLVVVGLVLVGALGVAGVASPGLVSVGEAFFILGASVAVLAIAVVVLLFSLRRTMQVLRQHKAIIDRHQDERAEMMREQQTIRDQLQDEQLGSLLQDQAERDRAQDERMERLVTQQERKFEEMVARMESQFEAIVSHQEARIHDLAQGVSDGNGGDAAPPRGPTPFGDIHPVVDVEGIGEVYEDALAELNIVDTEQLWLADADAVASSLDVAPKTVRQWQSMAELMALDKVGPQYGELLVRAGIDGIQALKNETPATLFDKVRSAEAERDVRIQGGKLSEKVVGSWIEVARTHDPQAQRVRR